MFVFYIYLKMGMETFSFEINNLDFRDMGKVSKKYEWSMENVGKYILNI